MADTSGGLFNHRQAPLESSVIDLPLSRPSSARRSVVEEDLISAVEISSRRSVVEEDLIAGRRGDLISARRSGVEDLGLE
jgi:hypothetical protein